MKRPYLLFKRGKYWYFRLVGESTFHTTEETDRKEAESYVVRLLEAASGSNPADTPTFRQYAAPFFVWDKCPYVRRVLEESGHMTERHVRIQRGRLENHVFPDPFADKRLSDITRADIFDLRSRLLKKNAPATVNKVIGVAKIILRESVIREELERDPTEYVRNVKAKKRARAIFTADELKKLFLEHGSGPWNNPRDYTCFYLAAVSGARRGALLVLRWRYIHFEQRFLHIAEAWKGRDKIGETKSGRERIVPLSDQMIEKLEALKLYSLHVKPDDFLFCYDDGKRVGEIWRLKRFKTALKRAGIEQGDRWLPPHSFRHTINTIARNSGHDPAKIRAVLGWMRRSRTITAIGKRSICVGGRTLSITYANRLRTFLRAYRLRKNGKVPSFSPVLDLCANCACTCSMDFHWDPKKAEANFLKHGVDFADAVGIFEGITIRYHRIRFSATGRYGCPHNPRRGLPHYIGARIYEKGKERI